LRAPPPTPPLPTTRILNLLLHLLHRRLLFLLAVSRRFGYTSLLTARGCTTRWSWGENGRTVMPPFVP